MEEPYQILTDLFRREPEEYVERGAIARRKDGLPIYSHLFCLNSDSSPISVAMTNNWGHTFLSHTLPSSGLERHIFAGIEHMKKIGPIPEDDEGVVRITEEPSVYCAVIGKNSEMMVRALDYLNGKEVLDIGIIDIEKEYNHIFIGLGYDMHGRILVGQGKSFGVFEEIKEFSLGDFDGLN
jgi:hypothetical protein